MALINGDHVVATFHVSTGKSVDPDRPRELPLLPQAAGRQLAWDVHVGLLHRGYATHGYTSVPMHEAASHGCVRNPIPFSVYIYNWINLGDAIHVYV